MKNTNFKTLLIGGLIVALGVLTYFNLALNKNIDDLAFNYDTSQATLEFMTDYSVELSESLADVSAEFMALQEEQAALIEKRDALLQEVEYQESRVALYEAQKYFLADAMDWFGGQYGFTDIEQILGRYTRISGEAPPESCEVITSERYLKWADSTLSTMFVVTPDKLGWTPYANWSVRENVVFSSDHRDLPGYLGSRGYEFRYPLSPGTQFRQEVHTTINVYSMDRSSFELSEDQFFKVIELNCGVLAYITLAEDDAQTTKIRFSIGGFDVDIKIKYEYDSDKAMALLEQAGNIVIDGLTSGW